MKMRDDILNDYEHMVSNKVAEHGKEDGFPSLEDYGINKSDFETYLFEKQALLDSGKNEKVRYTVWGILIVIPVVVLDCFPHKSLPWGDWSIYFGIALGIILCLMYEVISRFIHRRKLLNHNDEKMERYINDVLNY